MEPINITEANFEEEVLKYDGTVLVDYWASWCTPCRMISPLIDEIAKEEHKDLKVGKVNMDAEHGLGRKHRVMSIPTLIVYKNGKEIRRNVGTLPKEDILKLIK